jgi:alpha-L-rhamnosidase
MNSIKLFVTILVSLFLFEIVLAYESTPVEFKKAKPVWLKNHELEMNVTAGFRSVFSSTENENISVKIAASTIYRIFLNGKFIGHGPARGPHGFYRVDEWPLAGKMKNGKNIVAIEVAGYNSNSYYLLDQPSFCQTEIVSGQKVIAATGLAEKDFDTFQIMDRVQKVQRFSFQRPFIEVYNMDKNSNHWRTNSDIKITSEPIAVTENKTLIERGVPYSRFTKKPAVSLVSSGKLQKRTDKFRYWEDRSLKNVGPKLKGFVESDLAVVTSKEYQDYITAELKRVDKELGANSQTSLSKLDFDVVDFGTNLSGFIGAKVVCKTPTKVIFTFDELLIKDDVDFKRLGCVNAVTYQLQPGEYSLESFEPYTLRYLKLNCMKGECEISDVYLRDYTYPGIYNAQFASSDPDLNLLFETGRETFRQNTVDIFMDCPSRERAGWLCDSYFTARVAFDLSGETKVERNFYQNFLLPPKFENLPDGMLPMCYPADHYDGVFIPNWSLWFVVQLDEYAKRSGDIELVDALKTKVYNLFKYFEKFENSDGLLEKLESWVFVEWSKANSFVQDVNYPSNMLYSAALELAGKLYDDDELVSKAQSIRKTVLEQSYNGQFFVDNAVREHGKLVPTENISEVCQYFAFYFNVVSPKSHPVLWKNLTTKFGPIREIQNDFPNVHKANAFVGNYLRMELLSQQGRTGQIFQESKDFYLGMAKRTGTFWENMDERASCNHGFASHVSHVLYRDALGVLELDTVNKKLVLRFTDVNLEWCQGRMPLADGFLDLKWWKDQGKISYTLNIPAGYDVTVKDKSQSDVIRMF